MRAFAAIAVACLLPSLSARAAAPRDFVGARALGMAAQRAAAVGSEAIFLNPAALGFAARYSMQLDYSHSSAGKADLAGGGNVLALSIADSISNPRFPTGLAYRYMSTGSGAEERKGWTSDIAVGFPISDAALIGTRLTYVNYSVGERELKRINGDVGILFVLGGFSLGAVGFNLITVDAVDMQRGVATGISWGNAARTFRLAGDYRVDFGDKPLHSFAAGGELLLGDMFPVRVGYEWDRLRGTEFLSGGTGFVTPGFGVDASVRRDRTTGEMLWGFALKVFVN